MRVVVVGAGGRESAIAWACRRHGHQVTVLGQWHDVSDWREVPDPITDQTPSDDAAVDLVIVGPEAALVDGVAEACARDGVACFGPPSPLARLESSKGWARALADRLGIPGPAFARFDEVDEALAWVRERSHPVVVKADGLAAGKGVIVPEDLIATETAIREIGARGPFVLEERLRGPECSLLALCDGRVARALPLAQDHKRIAEADTGPNTGGMGAYAPAPVGVDAEELLATFVTPVIEHLAAAGTPYVGVLYAGLMLTADGPRLIEYNCRFGDPEAQAVLPLLDSDLAELALACTRGELAAADLRWSDRAAVTVVVAAPGYPAAPQLGGEVRIAPAPPEPDGTSEPTTILFPAGLALDHSHSARTTPLTGRTTGGRVLAMTGIGADLASARRHAYDAIARVRLDGMQVRRDIAWRAPGAQLGSYAAAGVDIDEGARAVSQMRAAVERTHTPAVVSGLGSFGGVFSLRELRSMDDPVLVASTDGVGTKVELAARLGRVRGIGTDIVNHCIDDVLVQGARPLFFLDYLAASELDARMVADIVTGMAEACEAARCALLGGETAEMPGVYAPGAFDVAGTLIGVAEGDQLLPRDDLHPGDLLLGLRSSGPHTNGYSLLRRLFEWLPMDVVPPGFSSTLGDALLEPHRSYLEVLDPVLRGGHVKALAHITGGGLPENLPRVLPEDVVAQVQLGSWPLPPLFQLVAEVATAMPVTELYRTLNMGIGMVAVIAPEDHDLIASLIDEPADIIGSLRPRRPGEAAVELLGAGDGN